jgi:H/ACA ribonucleoprotein complex subunit 2
MAKDKTDKEKKRDKKKKRSETDGVHKKEKKKKEKDIAILADAEEKELTTKVLDSLEAVSKETAANGDVSESKITVKEVAVRPVGSLVPFANPLANDKVAKKVLKSVKKGVLIEFFHIFYLDFRLFWIWRHYCEGTSTASQLHMCGFLYFNACNY